MPRWDDARDTTNESSKPNKATMKRESLYTLIRISPIKNSNALSPAVDSAWDPYNNRAAGQECVFILLATYVPALPLHTPNIASCIRIDRSIYMEEYFEDTWLSLGNKKNPWHSESWKELFIMFYIRQ
jgi:hypothetical protein